MPVVSDARVQSGTGSVTFSGSGPAPTTAATALAATAVATPLQAPSADALVCQVVNALAGGSPAFQSVFLGAPAAAIEQGSTKTPGTPYHDLLVRPEHGLRRAAHLVGRHRHGGPGHAHG